MKKIIIAPKFEQNRDSLIEIIENFTTKGYVLGNQPRNEIRVVKMGEKNLNIKSFKKPGIINKLIYGYFRKSKAERSYNYGCILKEKKIGTPEPIAYFENKNLMGLGNSYYISEHINALLTYACLLLMNDLQRHKSLRLVIEVIALLQLHHQNILQYH